jgi:Ca2+-binding EF-hand superfamily protein
MVEGGQEYKVGNKYLRNLKVDRNEVKNILARIGFKVSEAVWRSISADRSDEGYKGIIMISVLK